MFELKTWYNIDFFLKIINKWVYMFKIRYFLKSYRIIHEVSKYQMSSNLKFFHLNVPLGQYINNHVEE
jgi:hypothetical protein